MNRKTPRGKPPTGGGTGARPPLVRVVLERACAAANAITPDDLMKADDLLERIYTVAETLADKTPGDNVSPRRQGRRIMNLIDQVDEALGLDGDDA